MKFTRIVMGLMLEKYTIFSVENKDIFLVKKNIEFNFWDSIGLV